MVNLDGIDVGHVSTDSCDTVYKRTGSRETYMFGLKNGSIYASSPTLDQSSTEIYRFDPTPGATPELVATIPGSVHGVIS